jgi:hypothetical protein
MSGDGGREKKSGDGDGVGVRAMLQTYFQYSTCPVPSYLYLYSGTVRSRWPSNSGQGSSSRLPRNGKPSQSLVHSLPASWSWTSMILVAGVVPPFVY